MRNIDSKVTEIAWRLCKKSEYGGKTEKKSTVVKLRDELKDEHRRMYQCQFSLEAAKGQTTDNASTSKSIDLMPTVMSLSSTIDRQSLTIEQLMKKISNLEANEKLLKQQLADSN